MAWPSRHTAAQVPAVTVPLDRIGVHHAVSVSDPPLDRPNGGMRVTSPSSPVFGGAKSRGPPAEDSTTGWRPGVCCTGRCTRARDQQCRTVAGRAAGQKTAKEGPHWAVRELDFPYVPSEQERLLFQHVFGFRGEGNAGPTTGANAQMPGQHTADNFFLLQTTIRGTIGIGINAAAVTVNFFWRRPECLVRGRFSDPCTLQEITREALYTIEAVLLVCVLLYLAELMRRHLTKKEDNPVKRARKLDKWLRVLGDFSLLRPVLLFHPRTVRRLFTKYGRKLLEGKWGVPCIVGAGFLYLCALVLAVAAVYAKCLAVEKFVGETTPHDWSWDQWIAFFGLVNNLIQLDTAEMQSCQLLELIAAGHYVPFIGQQTVAGERIVSAWYVEQFRDARGGGKYPGLLQLVGYFYGLSSELWCRYLEMAYGIGGPALNCRAQLDSWALVQRRPGGAEEKADDAPAVPLSPRALSPKADKGGPGKGAFRSPPRERGKESERPAEAAQRPDNPGHEWLPLFDPSGIPPLPDGEPYREGLRKPKTEADRKKRLRELNKKVPSCPYVHGWSEGEVPEDLITVTVDSAAHFPPERRTLLHVAVENGTEADLRDKVKNSKHEIRHGSTTVRTGVAFPAWYESFRAKWTTDKDQPLRICAPGGPQGTFVLLRVYERQMGFEDELIGGGLQRIGGRVGKLVDAPLFEEHDVRIDWWQESQDDLKRNGSVTLIISYNSSDPGERRAAEELEKETRRLRGVALGPFKVCPLDRRDRDCLRLLPYCPIQRKRGKATDSSDLDKRQRWQLSCSALGLDLHGECSARRQLTLPPKAKARLQIPQDAEYFCFAYPCDQAGLQRCNKDGKFGEGDAAEAPRRVFSFYDSAHATTGQQGVQNTGAFRLAVPVDPKDLQSTFIQGNWVRMKHRGAHGGIQSPRSAGDKFEWDARELSLAFVHTGGFLYLSGNGNSIIAVNAVRYGGQDIVFKGPYLLEESSFPSSASKKDKDMLQPIAQHQTLRPLPQEVPDLKRFATAWSLSEGKTDGFGKYGERWGELLRSSLVKSLPQPTQYCWIPSGASVGSVYFPHGGFAFIYKTQKYNCYWKLRERARAGQPPGGRPPYTLPLSQDAAASTPGPFDCRASMMDGFELRRSTQWTSAGTDGADTQPGDKRPSAAESSPPPPAVDPEAAVAGEDGAAEHARAGAEPNGVSPAADAAWGARQFSERVSYCPSLYPAEGRSPEAAAEAAAEAAPPTAAAADPRLGQYRQLDGSQASPAPSPPRFDAAPVPAAGADWRGAQRAPFAGRSPGALARPGGARSRSWSQQRGPQTVACGTAPDRIPERVVLSVRTFPFVALGGAYLLCPEQVRGCPCWRREAGDGWLHRVDGNWVFCASEDDVLDGRGLVRSMGCKAMEEAPSENTTWEVYDGQRGWVAEPTIVCFASVPGRPAEAGVAAPPPSGRLPRKLQLSTPAEHRWAELAGLYELQAGQRNGRPWWRRSGGGGWLFSKDGRWLFAAQADHFAQGLGWLQSSDVFGGDALPCQDTQWDAWSDVYRIWHNDSSVAVTVMDLPGAQ
eukprot:TRINITY_DN13371_c0_g1_i1.p1 TRINITY_DN13371_c0_g1~~TRINITY_DN13371_c0_g1_i1.p1  ORF type:complete len:1581 (+),score=421.22 TRINITY_DN13371_c0_g1_i1:91-4743(+)